MKKFLFTLLFAWIGIDCNAQIYKTIKYYDKFDDEVKKEQHKTLITKTDSTFVIEEKEFLLFTIYCILSNKGQKDLRMRL